MVEGHLFDIVKLVKEGISGTELSVLLSYDIEFLFAGLQIGLFLLAVLQSSLHVLLGLLDLRLAFSDFLLVLLHHLPEVGVYLLAIFEFLFVGSHLADYLRNLPLQLELLVLVLVYLSL